MTHIPPSSAAPPGRPLPRRRDPKGTRDRLVRAALELFTSQGYHGTTTPEIARKAGVAEGTIYRHFDSKEHLLNEIYRAGLRLFATVLRTPASSAELRERLEQVATSWRDIAARNPAVVRLVFVSRFTPLLDQKSRELAREFRRDVESLVADGKASGQIRPGTAEVWADVWLSLMGLMLERVATKEWDPDQAAIRTVIDVAWTAIGVSGPAAPQPREATLPQGPPAGP